MANIFKNKNFWLTLAHIGTAAGSVALTIAFPAAIPAIIPIQALVNGLIPSPLNPPPVVVLPPSVVPPSVKLSVNATELEATYKQSQVGNVGRAGNIGLSIGDEMKMKDSIK